MRMLLMQCLKSDYAIAEREEDPPDPHVKIITESSSEMINGQSTTLQDHPCQEAVLLPQLSSSKGQC